MSDILYPDVEVALLGADGNAFSIISEVARGLRRAGLSEAAEAFMEEAMAGDYDHVLKTCMKYVSVY